MEESARERTLPRIRRPQASPTRPIASRPTERRTALPRPIADDHRWARPHPRHVHVHPVHPPPRPAWYTPWYTHWWVHPYYRWHHASFVVVVFDDPVYPWFDTWVAPVRYGWAWVPGYYWSAGWWVPGYYEPVARPPVRQQADYVFVPGWWIGTTYIEGFWRLADREGWVWVEGAYRADGTYAWGHWRPVAPGPEGYVWEPGTWDGEAWIEGFWRPARRAGHRWVSAAWGDDGVFRAGYWEPLEQRSGHAWIPGWFDGTEWIDGYWVPEAELEDADPEDWTPPAGWDAGRDVAPEPPLDETAPLALPVDA